MDPIAKLDLQERLERSGICCPEIISEWVLSAGSYEDGLTELQRAISANHRDIALLGSQP